MSIESDKDEEKRTLGPPSPLLCIESQPYGMVGQGKRFFEAIWQSLAIDYRKPHRTKSGALAIIISIEVHFPL